MKARSPLAILDGVVAIGVVYLPKKFISINGARPGRGFLHDSKTQYNRTLSNECKVSRVFLYFLYYENEGVGGA